MKNSKYFKYALGEIFLVVVGILIALSINNWNDKRKQGIQEQVILKKLKSELEGDIVGVTKQLEVIKQRQVDFQTCLAILSNQRSGRLEDFIENFQGVTTYTRYENNMTTFNSITLSRNIDYIKNKSLVDSLDSFYNYDFETWGEANKQYTRSVIVPYLMNFDYTPLNDYNRMNVNTLDFQNADFTQVDISKFEVAHRSLNDYKQNIFVINLLRQKLFLTEGQLKLFQKMKEQMIRLSKQIDNEIDK